MVLVEIWIFFLSTLYWPSEKVDQDSNIPLVQADWVNQLGPVEYLNLILSTGLVSGPVEKNQIQNFQAGWPIGVNQLVEFEYFFPLYLILAQWKGRSGFKYSTGTSWLGQSVLVEIWIWLFSLGQYNVEGENIPGPVVINPMVPVEIWIWLFLTGPV